MPLDAAALCDSDTGVLCGVWLCTQMFSAASAFNQNIASWNVLRAATMGSAFDSTTALVDCYRSGMYTVWGATLQAAYPTWSSLPVCTSRCVRGLVHTHGHAR